MAEYRYKNKGDLPALKTTSNTLNLESFYPESIKKNIAYLH
jgi:hypothetical protein